MIHRYASLSLASRHPQGQRTVELVYDSTCLNSFSTIVSSYYLAHVYE